MSLFLSDGLEVSLTAALKNERNLLSRLRRRHRAADFRNLLWAQRATIEEIVGHHLSLPKAQCSVEHPDTWIHGQFNVCVLIKVWRDRGVSCRKVFRCPMLHKVGHPANPDEKVRVEVANYAWIEQNCPEIPVPHLIGFGFSNHKQFTHESHLPWFQRLWRWLVRAICLRKSYPYAPTLSNTDIGPYLLLDFIENDCGVMLSETWEKAPRNALRMENLFRGLSRIILSLARIRLPQIGSFQFHDDCTITLSNRPLLCSHVLLESEGAPSIVQGPYPTHNSFLADLLSFREEWFLTQPNAVKDEEDCRLQMSHMVLLRNLLHSTAGHNFSGPYVLQHTDLHASNIFVDQNWNITGLIDLEFMCALPPQMIDVPYWLSAESIDTIDLGRHSEVYREFMVIFKEEEQVGGSRDCLGLYIHEAWNSGEFWYYHCLTSIDAMCAIMEDYIRPLYGFVPSLREENAFARCLSRFWSKESEEVVRSKIADKTRYDFEIQELYHAATNTA